MKEKDVKISKEQLDIIVQKIGDFIRNYIKSNQSLGQNNLKTECKNNLESNTNIQKLLDTIEKLEYRLAKIECGNSVHPSTVIKEDINIPEKITTSFNEWDMNPLTEIPTDSKNIIVLMKWLQHLINKCGHTNLSNILDYYVDIGWISEDVKINLIGYSHGITEEQKNDGENVQNISDLPSQDHIQSLLFIHKLKGRKLDKHFLDRIDYEISRITERLSNNHCK